MPPKGPRTSSTVHKKADGETKPPKTSKKAVDDPDSKKKSTGKGKNLPKHKDEKEDLMTEKKPKGRSKAAPGNKITKQNEEKVAKRKSAIGASLASPQKKARQEKDKPDKRALPAKEKTSKTKAATKQPAKSAGNAAKKKDAVKRQSSDWKEPQCKASRKSTSACDLSTKGKRGAPCSKSAKNKLAAKGNTTTDDSFAIQTEDSSSSCTSDSDFEEVPSQPFKKPGKVPKKRTSTPASKTTDSSFASTSLSSVHSDSGYVAKRRSKKSEGTEGESDFDKTTSTSYASTNSESCDSCSCGKSDCDCYTTGSCSCGKSDCECYTSETCSCGKTDCECYTTESCSCGKNDCDCYTSASCSCEGSECECSFLSSGSEIIPSPRPAKRKLDKFGLKFAEVKALPAKNRQLIKSSKSKPTKHGKDSVPKRIKSETKPSKHLKTDERGQKNKHRSDAPENKHKPKKTESKESGKPKIKSEDAYSRMIEKVKTESNSKATSQLKTDRQSQSQENKSRSDTQEKSTKSKKGESKDSEKTIKADDEVDSISTQNKTKKENTANANSADALKKRRSVAKQSKMKEVAAEVDPNDVMAILMQMEGKPSLLLNALPEEKPRDSRPSPRPAKSAKKSSATSRKRKAVPIEGMHSESSEMSDWEEVEDHHAHSPVKSQIPTAPVEIMIDDPGIMHKKRKKKEFDWKAYVERKVKRLAREIQVDMHKVNLLCLLSHGMQQNRMCSDDTVRALALSIVPAVHLQRSLKQFDSGAVLQVVRWFKQKIQVADKGWEEGRALVNPQQLMNVITSSTANEKRAFVMALVSVLRAMGLTVRLVISVHPLPLKNTLASGTLSSKGKKGSATTSRRTSTKVKQNSKQSSSASTSKAKTGGSKTAGKRGSKKTGNANTCSSSDDDECSYSDEDSGSKTKRRSSARPKKTAKKRIQQSKMADSDSDEGGCEVSDSDASNFSEEEDMARRRAKQRAKNLAKAGSSKDDNSESEFDLSFKHRSLTLTEEERQKKKPNRKILSSAESSSSLDELAERKVKQGQDIWLEVFLPTEGKWCCIDCFQCTVNKFYDMSEAASQPVLYVLAFDNEGAVKDVTAKYSPRWLSHTRKQRVDSSWWMAALEPFASYNVLLEDEENEHIKADLMKRPLPTSIGEFKNHPLYALRRHLLKYEAIYPENSIPVGYIRHEAVYARDSIHTLHSRDNWLREARVVRLGETAYKMVKSRKRWNQMKANPDELDLELFGRWQTEDYIPPPAVNGKVPKNEYGNVELFQPSMLPGGTVHVRVPALNRVARKLNIDIAAAMTGWDHHCGFSHPVLDGWVVCEEHKDILLAAWEEDQEIQKQREEERREKRVLDNWTTLVRGLLIKEKLKKKFNLEEKKAEPEVKKHKGKKKEELATDVQHAWPAKQQKRQMKSEEQTPQPSHFTVETM